MAWIKKSAAITLLILITVISIGVLLTYIRLTKPVTATNITTAGNISVAPSLDLTPVWVDSKYASFSYPKILKPMKQDSLSGSQLALLSYSYSDVETWHMVISINNVPGATLQGDSSYAYRENNPSQYQQSSETYGDNTFVVMTDTQSDDFRKVAFLLHGSESADISLYGNDTQSLNGLTETFAQVLKSWTWQ